MPDTAATSISSRPCVIGITATYKRSHEVARLFESLKASTTPLHSLIVVDNGGENSVQTIVENSAIPSVYINPGRNLGCGGGLAAGEKRAFELFRSSMTHIWILDDDTVVEPETLASLIAAMDLHGAVAANPMVVDDKGLTGWVPGIIDSRIRKPAEKPQPPNAHLSKFTGKPRPFSWAQGIALLVRSDVVESIGFHRGDYWIRGEDLEFSLRITAFGKGIFVPEARVMHLPPPPGPNTPPDGEYRKQLAMLQNIAYTVCLPHGRTLALHMPSNWVRFALRWKRPSALWDSLVALYLGAVRRMPAGTSNGISG